MISRSALVFCQTQQVSVGFGPVHPPPDYPQSPLPGLFHLHLMKDQINLVTHFTQVCTDACAAGVLTKNEERSNKNSDV